MRANLTAKCTSFSAISQKIPWSIRDIEVRSRKNTVNVLSRSTPSRSAWRSTQGTSTYTPTLHPITHRYGFICQNVYPAVTVSLEFLCVSFSTVGLLNIITAPMIARFKPYESDLTAFFSGKVFAPVDGGCQTLGCCVGST